MTESEENLIESASGEVVNQGVALGLYINMLMDEASDEEQIPEAKISPEPEINNKLNIEPEPEPEPEPNLEFNPQVVSTVETKPLDTILHELESEEESSSQEQDRMRQALKQELENLKPVDYAEPELKPEPLATINLQPELKPEPEQSLEIPGIEENRQEKTPEPEPSVEAQLEEQAEQSLSIMPDWSHEEFQALYFRVDNMVLATPLVELSRTIKFDREITKIPQQPSWFIGLLEEQGKRVGVLDTGQLIFGKTLGSQRDINERPFKCMLISRDGNWGLACDEILSIGRLDPNKVRWRTQRQKRTWLIGTVIEELTAIIDVNELIPRRKK